MANKVFSNNNPFTLKNKSRKTPFWPFLAVNNGFLCVFKKNDQNNICAFIVFKAETIEKYENIFFGFYFKLKNALYWGQTIFFCIFF